MINELISDIRSMLTNTKTVEFNPVVGANKNRGLGSGNQCYHVMYRVASHFGIKKMLEIGTHQGMSSISFCQGIIDAGNTPEIHTVDSWCQADRKAVARANMEKAGFGDYITMHEGDSLTKVPEVLSQIGNVDLAFIDGNHDPVFIMKDFDNCKMYSSRILFHDTGNGERAYLREIEKQGWTIYNFETKYVEGDGHPIGIALALKN
jgi:tRNA A58 N-methylase Trm61